MTFFILTIYSALLFIFFKILQLLTFWSSYWQRQFSGRRLPPGQLFELKSQATNCDMRCIFFVSSAGEYEQAKPLIERLKNKQSVFILIVFFSDSGFQYARSMQETCTYIKAPLDTLWNWRRLLGVLKPTLTVVVRHELWPGFCYLAAKRSEQFILIDGQRNNRITESMPRRLISQWLMSHFSMIYVIDRSDKEFYHEVLGVPHNRLKVSGDTKYDRVFQRLEERRTLASQLTDVLRRYDSSQKRLVIGSAWLPDVELVLQAYLDFPLRTFWQIIIAPHDISDSMLNQIMNKCRDLGLSVQRYSSLLHGEKWPGFSGDVLLLDQMGLLAEVYAAVDAAFIGGALHARVHNVLEPACRGVPITFGPRYQTSREAVVLVDRSAIIPVSSVTEMLAWWGGVHQDGSKSGAFVLNSIKSYCGATDLIGRDIQKEWRPSK